MYYIYVTSGPSLLIESTDSMIYMQAISTAYIVYSYNKVNQTT